LEGRGWKEEVGRKKLEGRSGTGEVGRDVAWTGDFGPSIVVE
jgi:hypothetical protein